jgi:hypothetical protein
MLSDRAFLRVKASHKHVDEIDPWCQNLALFFFLDLMLERMLSDGPLGVVGPVDDVEEGKGQGEQLSATTHPS